MICPQPLTQSKPILLLMILILLFHIQKLTCFQICMNDVFAGLNKWIKANKLSINFYKTNFMKFCTTNKNCVNLSIGYVDKTNVEVETTKFLGLQVDNNLNWKTHIQYIVPKLSSTCFAMRTITSLMKTETLKFVYFAYFHSIVSHEIIFWGNSTDSKKYFTSKRRSSE
jgi:hypothetical protein